MFGLFGSRKPEKIVPLKGLEKCVLCHRVLPTRKSEPVESRQHYVHGSGQLCPECHAEVYGEKK